MSPQPRSGTVADLGRAVRAKYPGQYDDLNDQQLGVAVKQKYAGQYDDFGDLPAQTPDPQSNWSHFFSQLNPVPQIKAAWEGLTAHPLATLASTAVPGGPVAVAAAPLVKNLIDAHIDQAKKAKAAFDQGNYLEALGHVGGAALPVVGPMAAHIGELAGGSEPQYDRYGNVVRSGQAPNPGGAAAELAGAAAPLVAGEVVPRVVKIPPVVKTSLNPVEGRAVQFADQEGIPLDLATRTGSKPARNTQTIVQNQPGGYSYAQGARQAQNDALTATGNRLADKAYPVPVSAEDAGAAAIGELKQGITTLDQQASSAYKQFRKAESYPQNRQSVPVRTEIVDGKPQPVYQEMALPVDMRPVKDALQPIYQRYARSMPIAMQRASQGLKALQNILEEDDFKPASVAEMDLGAIKQAARSEMPELRDVSQGLAAKAVQDLDHAIRGTVDQAYWPGHTAGAGGQNPALQSLLEGRARTAEKWDVADTLKSFGRNIDDLEPVQVFNQLTWGKDSGIQRLRELQQRAPQSMPAVGRAYVEGMLDTATREGNFDKTGTLKASWDKLGPETKKVLFPDSNLRTSLDNFFLLAKRIGENPNPSGTAHMGSTVAAFAPAVGMIIHNPASAGAAAAGTGAYVIGNAALSRLLFNPSAARLLAHGFSVPVGSKLTAAAVAQRILNAAGSAAQPYQPDTSK